MTSLNTTLKAFLVFLTVLFSCEGQAKQTLTEKERQLVTAVAKALPSTLNGIETAVNINSGTMNFSGVKAVGKLMIDELTALGFDARWHDGSAFNRAGHVVASYISKNKQAKKILMIGHLDTVFNQDDPFQRFEYVSETQIRGPGIIDMKGGNAIILASLSALKQAGVLENLSVKVVMTGDEENSGRPLSLSKKAIVDAAKWADIALGFEDGDGSIETAVIARRGYTGWTLTVSGKPAHSSQIFREDIGYGAIYESARILNGFREQLSTIENLTFNPGIIAGGTFLESEQGQSKIQAFGKSNVIAQSVQVRGDLRALTMEQVTHAKKVMTAIVKDNLAHTKAEIHFEPGYPPMAPTKGNKQLLQLYHQVSKDLGHGDVVGGNPRKAGAADISFAASYVDMALDGLGLMGTGGHTKDEMADITSLHKNIEKATLLMHRLSRQ